jgi:hypothetical protein
MKTCFWPAVALSAINVVAAQNAPAQPKFEVASVKRTSCGAIRHSRVQRAYDHGVARAFPNPPADLFTAIRHSLGLRLEPRKEPVEVLAIDHIERVPTGN